MRFACKFYSEPADPDRDILFRLFELECFSKAWSNYKSENRFVQCTHIAPGNVHVKRYPATAHADCWSHSKSQGSRRKICFCFIIHHLLPVITAVRYEYAKSNCG